MITISSSSALHAYYLHVWCFDSPSTYMYMYTHTHSLSFLLSLCLLLSFQSRLPKAATSLKVLAELPIIVVLMYQVRSIIHVHECVYVCHETYLYTCTYQDYADIDLQILNWELCHKIVGYVFSF